MKKLRKQKLRKLKSYWITWSKAVKIQINYNGI
jgi:hypothetical protein